MTAQHPYLSAPGPRPFAHRGWHIGDLAGMENSLSAFQRASEEGYRYMETDIQVTADGVVVVHHDRDLDRTTDRTGAISSLPWSQVKHARVNGREPVSRLEDILEELPNAHLNIDVKSDAAVDPFVRVIERTGAMDRIAAASFSSRRLTRLRKQGGNKLATCMSPRAFYLIWSGSRIGWTGLGRLTSGLMAQVPLRYGGLALVDERLVRTVHRLGAEVHAWTVNASQPMYELLDMGVDGIVTDRPDLLRAILIGRGLWEPDTG